MDASTVHLTGPYAPSGKDFHKGYIEIVDDKGVVINDRDDGRGKRTFYPAHVVVRIEYDTGW